MFLQGGDKLSSFLRLPVFLQNHSTHGLARAGAVLEITWHTLHKEGISLTVLRWHLLASDGYQVEIVHHAAGEVFILIVLVLAHQALSLLIVVQCFLVQVAECLLLHARTLLWQCLLGEQGHTCQLFHDKGGGVPTAAHPFIPAPASVFVLQTLQLH